MMNSKKLLTPAFISGFILLISTSCRQAPDIVAAEKELLELDEKFSRTSEEIGASEAFIRFIDDSAVLLRPNRYPIEGKDKIIELYDRPDTGFLLTWEPLFARVAKSGDLGYTYGIYTMKMSSPDGTPVVNEGTYVTIWGKDSGGNWKFLLDTGNPGVERKKPDLE